MDNADEAEWAASLLSAVEPRGFRVPRQLQARDRRWVVDGWVATEWLAGTTGSAGRWAQLLRAAREFHAALASAPKPTLLETRTHRWARADRVAWHEQAADNIPTDAADLFGRLERVWRPVSARSQLIHGDLSGNVLFSEGAAPAIIDFSPYWRPVAYAEAIVVVDGLLWFGVGPNLLTASTGRNSDFAQMLVRAVTFRLIALTERAREIDPSYLTELPRFEPVVHTVTQLARQASR